MMKTCQWCDKEFEAKRKDSRYCYEPHYKDCEACGEPFIIKEMKRPGKTCSKSCSDALTQQGSTVSKRCQWCGDDFLTTNRRAKFCDKDHYGTCSVCGDEFTVSNVHKPAKTCSPRCAWGSVEDKDAVYQKTQDTLEERYGFRNASQVSEVKEKKRRSAVSRYGVENVSQAPEVQQKRKKTFQQRFGHDNPYLSEVVRDKAKATNLKRYGVENVFQNERIKEKSKQTMMRKHGVDNISKLPTNRAKVEATTLRLYGVKSALSLPENQLKASLASKKRISKINRSWKTRLEDAIGMSFELESPFGDGNYADLGHDNVLIDINPTVTHNSTISYVHRLGHCREEGCDKASHQPRSKSYHQERAFAAEKEGKILLQYFDWHDPGVFTEIVRAKLKRAQNTVFARRCEIREVSQAEANRFFADNHLLGGSNKQTLCVGLFYEGEMVHCQTYGPARISKSAEWEAIRSCSKLNYHIPGAFSRCDKYFFSSKDPESVVSYVDLSISQGHTDSMFSGWTHTATNRPGATWVKTINNPAYPMFIRGGTARRVSADRLLGFEVGDKYPRYNEHGEKITNDFVLESEGFVKVYDAGTKTFIWRNEELDKS